MFIKRITFASVYLFLSFIYPYSPLLDISWFSLEWIPFTMTVFTFVSMFLFHKELSNMLQQINLKQIIVVTIIGTLGILLVSSVSKSLTTTNAAAIEEQVISNNRLFLLVSVTTGPFVEEMVFRYCLISNEEHHWIVLFQILFSSLLFSISHGQDFLFYFIMGFILGSVFLWKKNIWFSLVIHFLNNIIFVLVLVI